MVSMLEFRAVKYAYIVDIFFYSQVIQVLAVIHDEYTWSSEDGISIIVNWSGGKRFARNNTVNNIEKNG